MSTRAAARRPMATKHPGPRHALSALRSGLTHYEASKAVPTHITLPHGWVYRSGQAIPPDREVSRG